MLKGRQGKNGGGECEYNTESDSFFLFLSFLFFLKPALWPMEVPGIEIQS